MRWVSCPAIFCSAHVGHCSWCPAEQHIASNRLSCNSSFEEYGGKYSWFAQARERGSPLLEPFCGSGKTSRWKFAMPPGGNLGHEEAKSKNRARLGWSISNKTATRWANNCEPPVNPPEGRRCFRRVFSSHSTRSSPQNMSLNSDGRKAAKHCTGRISLRPALKASTCKKSSICEHNQLCNRTNGNKWTRLLLRHRKCFYQPFMNHSLPVLAPRCRTKRLPPSPRSLPNSPRSLASSHHQGIVELHLSLSPGSLRPGVWDNLPKAAAGQRILPPPPCHRPNAVQSLIGHPAAHRPSLLLAVGGFWYSRVVPGSNWRPLPSRAMEQWSHRGEHDPRHDRETWIADKPHHAEDLRAKAGSKDPDGSANKAYMSFHHPPPKEGLADSIRDPAAPCSLPHRKTGWQRFQNLSPHRIEPPLSGQNLKQVPLQSLTAGGSYLLLSPWLRCFALCPANCWISPHVPPNLRVLEKAPVPFLDPLGNWVQFAVLHGAASRIPPCATAPNEWHRKAQRPYTSATLSELPGSKGKDTIEAKW